MTTAPLNPAALVALHGRAVRARLIAAAAVVALAGTVVSAPPAEAVRGRLVYDCHVNPVRWPATMGRALYWTTGPNGVCGKPTSSFLRRQGYGPKIVTARYWVLG